MKILNEKKNSKIKNFYDFCGGENFFEIFLNLNFEMRKMLKFDKKILSPEF